jgi:hypothetical protein
MLVGSAAARWQTDDVVTEEPTESAKGEPHVNDQLDVTVHDIEVLAEIEMMTNLIIATSESDGPLPQIKIDEILGVADDTPPI